MSEPSETDYSAVEQIYQAMQTETVRGIKVSEIVGGGSPLEIARGFVEILKSQAGLNSSDRILDVGCGCGRMAAALTQHIDRSASYCGVDIIPGLIDFANRHIASRYPNFRFYARLQSNATYDYYRDAADQQGISRIAEICPDGSIDLCFATSLFTHLDAGMVRSNLAEMRCALAPAGRIFASFFLLDPTTRALMRRREPPLRFAHEGTRPGVFHERQTEPMYAVAFVFDDLARMIAEEGLYIERILYGSWPKRPHHVWYQDVLIMRKIDG